MAKRLHNGSTKPKSPAALIALVVAQEEEEEVAPQKAFITLKFETCMLIIQHHPTLPNPQPSIKLRERNGSLWEAFYTNEETQTLFDDMDQLSDSFANDVKEAYSWSKTLESFRQEHHPSKPCAFKLKVTTRKEAIVSSTFLSRRLMPLIANGTVVPEFVAMHKKEDADQKMTADFFVKNKHYDRDFDLHMTCYDSIRLTFLRVPEFPSEEAHC